MIWRRIRCWLLGHDCPDHIYAPYAIMKCIRCDWKSHGQP